MVLDKNAGTMSDIVVIADIQNKNQDTNLLSTVHACVTSNKGSTIEKSQFTESKVKNIRIPRII